ncbi:TRAP transporter small permease [Roseibium marinum]|uniref:TRAP transporter small permease protein n=1 Tax=Roseibium marinum TaxID=281252 RepID=A0A2S3UQ73_9HYPH|nr:TRAP transporter small permease subunit [Roseibium marinum]POF29693.1 tripartite ATP-independent transporter DctQ subunit [Roseibium marinum]
MALVFAIIFVNSLRRYTVGQSVSWGEELPIYLTIYGVMFGLALAYMQDRHIRFTVITDFLPDAARQKLFAAVDLASCVTGIALAYSGHAFTVRRGHLDASGLKSTGNWLAETTGIEGLVWIAKVGTWQYAIAIGGAMLAVAAFLKFIERISSFKAVPA